MDARSQSEHGTWSECTRPDGRSGPRSISVDRPTWVAMVKFCQLLNPADFVHLNHALSIGSVMPALPIDKERVEILNKMIELVWGDDLVIIVPMVVTAAEIGNQRAPNGMTPPKTPVSGLNVRTQQVIVTERDVLEKVIGKAKSDYKYMGPSDCIEAGCELVLSSILGNLITQPSKPSIQTPKPQNLQVTEKTKTDRPSSIRSSRRRNRSSSRHHHQEPEGYYNSRPRDQRDYMEGNLWSKIKRALTE
jgi:hypothetical protein